MKKRTGWVYQPSACEVRYKSNVQVVFAEIGGAPGSGATVT